MFLFLLSTVPVSGVAVPYGPGSEFLPDSKKGWERWGTETQTAGHSGAGQAFHNKEPDPVCSSRHAYCVYTIDL